MSMLSIAIGAAVGFVGIAVLVRSATRPVVDIDAVLSELDAGQPHLDEFSERVATPFMPRLMRPAGASMVRMVKALLPSNYLERVRGKLAVAGLGDRVTAEEFVAIQLVALGAGVLLGLVIGLAAGWTATGI